jgi:hypothetical protein
MEKGREKYHMVYGYMVSYRTVLVSYRTVYGIVPYGIGPQGVKTACLCEEEACLLQI